MEDDREVLPGQIWQHYKGTFYRVIYLGINTETSESEVIYTKCTEPGEEPGQIWIRPLNVFLEELDGNIKRFVYVRDE